VSLLVTGSGNCNLDRLASDAGAVAGAVLGLSRDLFLDVSLLPASLSPLYCPLCALLTCGREVETFVPLSQREALWVVLGAACGSSVEVIPLLVVVFALLVAVAVLRSEALS